MLIDRHLEVYRLARDCVELGARHQTLTILTGLSDAVLAGLFADQPAWRRSGRMPASTETYLNQSLTDRVEIALFANLFEDMWTDSVRAGQALVGAYRLYMRYCGVRPRVSFDVAFMFASHLRGIWLCDTQQLALSYCEQCERGSVTEAGTDFVVDCPFCKVLDRFRLDRRLRDHFAGDGGATAPFFALPRRAAG